jgi:hypothetical protein
LIGQLEMLGNQGRPTIHAGKGISVSHFAAPNKGAAKALNNHSVLYTGCALPAA